MEEYGGPAAPPRPPKPAARVHRASPAAARHASAAAAAAAGTVSLLRPRPEAERERNAYVEAPQRARPPPAPRKGVGGGGGGGGGAVTTQPGGGGGAGEKRSPCSPTRDSVVCEECGRCRCEQCARPRPLPSRWLGDFCLCSAETAVDYASCACCVKALLYHCGGGGGEEGEEADACGCGGGARAVAARWGCLAALSAVLPCLCLYWPLRGCAACGAYVYARASRTGCRCPEPAASPSAAPPTLSSII